jgi:hypothetical protein
LYGRNIYTYDFLNVANKKNEKMRKEKGNINFPHKIAL